MQRTTTRWKVAAGAATLALLVTACGDDDDDAATTTTEDPNAEYCALAEELDNQEALFTAEQLEQLRDAAPEEIRDEAEIIVPILIEGIESGDPFGAFENPVVEENIKVIEDFEAEVCGLSDEGDDEGATVEIAPEDEEYCAIATTLNEQEEFASAEQLEAIRAAAPEEIAEEINTVVDIFLANLDDPFAAFDDPTVGAAFEVIEPFDAEHCGIESDEAEQDPSVTEPDASAAQVAVTATDYAFAFAPDPAAGRTQFTMTNAGDERHVMLFFRIADGATLDEVLESEGEEGIEGPELESDSAAAGETAILTTDLEPGSYGMICYIPDADGTPHLALGMANEITVQ